MKRFLFILTICPALVFGQIQDFNLQLRLPKGFEMAPPAAQSAPYPARVESRSLIDPALAKALKDGLDKGQSVLKAIGVSAAVQLPDGQVWKGVAGVSSATAGDTIRPDMIFGVGSVSKTIAGACVMSLVEQGKLSLSDRVDKWLPAFPNVNPAITVQQLLNHTSGVYNFTDNPALNTAVSSNFAKIWTPQEVLNQFVRAPLFTPGNGWTYSNSGYLLLGLIVEAAAGKPYHEVVKTNLFDKVGLQGVILFPNEQTTQELAHLWADLLGGGFPIDLQSLNISMNALFSVAWTAGAYQSTPENIAKWMRHLFKGEVVSQASLTEMKKYVQVTPSYQYGLGISRYTSQGYELLGHGGDIIYKSLVLYIPDCDISIAVTSNDGTKTNMSVVFEEIFKAYLAYKMTPVFELKNENQVAVFPNPFSENLTISFDLKTSSDLCFSIVNEQGQVIQTVEYQQVPTGKQIIKWSGDVSNLPKGIYFLKVETEGKTLTQTLLKH